MPSTMRADDVLPDMAAHPIEDRVAVLERQVLRLTQAMASMIGGMEVAASLGGKRMLGDES